MKINNKNKAISEISFFEKIKINCVFIFSLCMWFVLISILQFGIADSIQDNLLASSISFQFIMYFILFIYFYLMYYVTYLLPFDIYSKNIEYMNKLKNKYLFILIAFIIFKTYMFISYLNSLPSTLN